MFRLLFKTFFGPEQFDEHSEHASAGGHETHAHPVHESSWVMLFPLVILAILSIIGGWVGVPAALWGHDEIGHFLDPVFSSGAPAEITTATASHGLELTLAFVSVLVALLGAYVAYLFYIKKPRTAAAYAAKYPALYDLVANKFYIDELYQFAAVNPLLMFTRFVLGTIVEKGVVEGSGTAAGLSTQGLGYIARSIQSGNIRSYAGWLALGAAAVLAVMIFGRSLWAH
jgi:NADH-quinone oxidoreductase subunit L